MAIPLYSRVPGRASRPSQSLGQRRRQIAMYSGKVIGYLGFFHRGVFIGEGALSEMVLVGLTTGGRGPALGRAPWWCGPPVAPLRLLFGSLEALVNIWTSGFCFVQF
jgi:hypothetical protein